MVIHKNLIDIDLRAFFKNHNSCLMLIPKKPKRQKRKIFVFLRNNMYYSKEKLIN